MWRHRNKRYNRAELPKPRGNRNQDFGAEPLRDNPLLFLVIRSMILHVTQCWHGANPAIHALDDRYIV